MRGPQEYMLPELPSQTLPYMNHRAVRLSADRSRRVCRTDRIMVARATAPPAMSPARPQGESRTQRHSLKASPSPPPPARAAARIIQSPRTVRIAAAATSVGSTTQGSCARRRLSRKASAPKSTVAATSTARVPPQPPDRKPTSIRERPSTSCASG